MSLYLVTPLFIFLHSFLNFLLSVPRVTFLKKNSAVLKLLSNFVFRQFNIQLNLWLKIYTRKELFC